MAIPFQCPHCQRSFKLKDEMAGKRVTCSGCRKVFAVPAVVPAPVGSVAAANGAPAADPTKPPADADALALSVLADEAPPKKTEKPAEAAAGEPITLKCEFCDHVNRFEARMAGKNAPCGDCRRILKVPLPVKVDPKDWRTVKAKPSLARQDTEQLEGAWGNVQTTAVSREAMVQAEVGVELEEEEPRSWPRRIARVLVVLGVVGLVIAGGVWGWNRYNRGKNQNTMEQALKYVDPTKDPKGKVSKLKSDPAASLIFLLASQHDIHLGIEAATKEAKAHVVQARARIKPAANTPDRYAAAIEILCAMADLLGSPDEVARKVRLDFEKDGINKEMNALLDQLKAIPGDDGRDLRSHAFRQLTRRLVARDQLKLPIVLANRGANPDERSEIVAVIGLEFLALGRRDLAEEMAAAATVSKFEGASSLVALWMAIGDSSAAEEKKTKSIENAKKVFPNADRNPLVGYRVGLAEGLARQGSIDAARARAVKESRPEELLRVLAAVAGAVIETRPGEVADLDLCAKLVDGDLKGKSPPWLMMRLIELSGKAGKADLAARFADAIADPGLRAWGQYEALRIRLKTLDSAAKAELAWAEAVGSPTDLGRYMACAAVARHNARNSAGVAGEVQDWKPEEIRPFGLAGVALKDVPSN